ncbi:MAG: histone deacetylase, partial [Blastocatellia bacterium]
MKTALVFSNDYLRHETGRHPEQPDRYNAALTALQADVDLWRELVPLEPRAITDAEITRCHDPRMITALDLACQQAPAHLDPDTAVSAHSALAARMA